MNSYVTLTRFKATGILNITGTTDDVRLLQLIENVSREVDRHCHRHFYPLTAINHFSGKRTEPIRYPADIDASYYVASGFVPFRGQKVLYLPDDLISVTSLKEDTYEDDTYPTTWAATDYNLVPYTALPLGPIDEAKPYQWIEVNTRSNGKYQVFKYSQKAYRLDGIWGYLNVSEASGATVKLGFDAVVTVFTANTPTALEIGMTIKIDSEQMYVTGIATENITVKRAVNGTVAAAHLINVVINKYLYPGTIIEAVIMQANRLWTRRTSGFTAQIGFSETGQLTPITGLDRDVTDMLRGSGMVKRIARMRVL